MKKLKLGMVGGGPGAFIGNIHRVAARITNQYELVGGVFSSDIEKSKTLAALEGLPMERVYMNVDEMIEKENALPDGERMEVVSIVTPNYLHYDAAKKLLNSGYHLFCEKPVTVTSKEAEELQQIIEQKKLVFGLAHAYTGYPMVRQMRDMILSGEIGNIQRIDGQYYQGWINPIIHGAGSHLSTWRLDPDVAGNSCCMGDIGVHAFNLIEYTTGQKVTQVLADLNTLLPDVKLDIDGTVLLRFDANYKGVIRASQIATGEENNIIITVYGSKASLRWEQENPNYLTMLVEGEPRRILKPGNAYNSEFAEMGYTFPCGHPEGLFDAFGNLLKGMAKAIKGEPYEKAEFPNIVDGVRGMKFIEGVLKSHQNNNSWVTL
ncbi:MAG: Gfo/Idh/MocA family protein [Bacteroidota bacterium]